MVTVTETKERLFLDGQWVETGEWLEVRSPFSGDVVATVAKAGAEEARRAIDAAETRIRDAVPIARVIYIEPDIYRAPATP